MKSLVFATTLILSTSLLATSGSDLENQFGSLTVEEISSHDYKSFGTTTGGTGGGFPGPIPTNPLPTPTPSTSPFPSPTSRPGADFDNAMEKTGKVIATARELVALGEALYTLVQKGKPSNITEYAPISVVPKDPMTKEPVDPFDLENFSMPVERNYKASIKNGAGKEVVSFSYKVLFSYGGSFDGAGKYLSNVLIVPGSVKTSYGWDFNATMKLSGIMNHGTRTEPVAGIMVTIKYQMNSWSAAFERNDTIHISGKGEIKNYNM